MIDIMYNVPIQDGCRLVFCLMSCNGGWPSLNLLLLGKKNKMAQQLELNWKSLHNLLPTLLERS